MLPLFRVLARLKVLRGTVFDVFGHTAERRLERQLVTDYEALVDTVPAGLDQDNHETAVELLRLPERIRGFGVVRQRSLAAARTRQQELMARFAEPVRATGAVG